VTTAVRRLRFPAACSARATTLTRSRPRRTSALKALRRGTRRHVGGAGPGRAELLGARLLPGLAQPHAAQPRPDYSIPSCFPPGMKT
jgi:hypothetical protein